MYIVFTFVSVRGNREPNAGEVLTFILVTIYFGHPLSYFGGAKQQFGFWHIFFIDRRLLAQFNGFMVFTTYITNASV